MMFLKLRDTDIGKKLYLLDYSYSTKLSGKSEWHVAGPCIDYKLVTILSPPYKLKYELWGTERESEFVTVAYEDLILVVLNRFSETKPEKEIYFDDYHSLFYTPKEQTPEMKKAVELIASYSKEICDRIEANNRNSRYPFTDNTKK